MSTTTYLDKKDPRKPSSGLNWMFVGLGAILAFAEVLIFNLLAQMLGFYMNYALAMLIAPVLAIANVFVIPQMMEKSASLWCYPVAAVGAFVLMFIFGRIVT